MARWEVPLQPGEPAEPAYPWKRDDSSRAFGGRRQTTHDRIFGGDDDEAAVSPRAPGSGKSKGKGRPTKRAAKRAEEEDRESERPAAAAVAASAEVTAADSPPPSSLRIGSLNVHGFKDARGRNRTFGEVVSLLDAHRLDVIALQEARWHDVVELARALGNMFWVTSRSTALLSRFPLRTTDEYGHGVGSKNFTAPHFHVSNIKRSGCETRHARALAMLPPALGGGALEVVSIHLDHVAEPRRLAQLQQLMWHVTNSEAAAAAHSATPGGAAAAPAADDAAGGSLSDAVWMGDMNALTRADYDEAEWREVAAVRKRGNWEAPVSDLTSAITGASSRGGLGFVDARVAAPERPGPRSTCRYDTRIDYTFLGPGLARRWRVAACEHVVAIPTVTDHNLVVTTLERG